MIQHSSKFGYDWRREFNLRLYHYFVLKDQSAREQIDEFVNASNLEDMKKMQRVITMCEQVSPAIDELLPSCPYYYTTHNFFINFWRINMDEECNHNLSELTLWAIAEKHRVAIDHEEASNTISPNFALKVYPSRKPRYTDKRANP